MSQPARCLIHATAIAAAGRAALIIGPSGSGKSDLALRAITTPFIDNGRLVEVALVADDQVVVEAIDGRLVASAPATIAGKLEVRGIGIMDFPHKVAADLVLVVMLRPADEIERLPSGKARHTLLGIDLPQVEIDAREPGAAARLVLALLRVGMI